MCKKTFVFFLGKGLQFLFIAIVLSLMAIVPALAADNDHIGATDPMSPARRSLFKDNEAFMFQGRNWEQKVKYYAMEPTTDNTLEHWDIADTEESINNAVQGCNGDIRPVAAASGRLESHKYDSAVSAYFDMEQTGGAVNVAVMNQGRTGRIATWKGSDCGYGDRSVDLAVADLDGYKRTVKYDNSNDIQVYSDEIVVVFTETYNDVRVYKVNVLELAPDGTLNSLWYNSGRFSQNIKYVAAVTGDFDGDLKNEFAIAVSGDDGDTNIISYKITLDEDQNRVFTKTGRMTLNTAGVGLDMTAGDFDGDGADELFLVMGKKPILYYVMKFEPDPDNNTRRWVLHDHKIVDGNKHHRALRGELRVVSGLFKLDPENGFGLNKRQAMVVYASGDSGASYIDCNNKVRAYILDIGDLDNVKTLNSHHFARRYESLDTSHRHMDVTVGNFIGHGQHDDEATSPVEQAMISFQWWAMGPYGAAIFTRHAVAIFDPGSTCEISMPLDCDVDGQDCEHDMGRSKYNYRSALAAPDSDGDTWVLGPPAHAMVTQYLSMDYFIQEPPKQVDYLPVDSTNWNPGTEKWGNPWEINNISGYSQFYTSLESSKTGSLTSTATETSSWDIGGSASFTFEEGFGIKGLDSVSVKSTTKLSYDHKAEASHYNKNYHSKTVSNGLKTNDDDMLVYRYQFLDIWRYPVFGFDTDPKNETLLPLGCYELIFPSNVRQAYGNGRTCSDWFQPLHTSGNLLSYPFGTDSKKPPQIPDPDDIGEYKLKVGDNESNKKQCFNEPTTSRIYSGNAIDMNIYWVDSATEGATRSSSNTMSESESITTSASGSFEIANVSAESEFSFHNSNSWGSSASRESVQTNSTGIALKIPEIPTGNTYSINTAAYYSANGTLKVIHGVIMPGAETFWKNYYNVYPDPGLNLPFRFEYHINNPTGDWWSLETDPLKRMKARGIFIRKNQPNAVSGLYDCLGMALQDGDEVRVCARIHNYSMLATGPFHVRFEYVPIDASSHEMNPAVNRTVIGVTADPISLAGGEMQEVHVLWDTTGLAGKFPDATYRIYVVVDPYDDVPDEIHDWKDIANAGKADWADEQGRLYHGNNEGYWPNGTGLAVLKTPDAAPFAAVDASLHDKSLSIQVGDQLLDQGNIIVRMGQTYPFRVHIKHSAPIRRFQHVLISEQHPSTSSEVIADHLIFGSEGNDAWIWGKWTPKAAGEYDLHAQVLEDHNDPIPGNALDSLKVIVQDTASGDGGSSGCFINSLMPGGGM